MSARLKVRALSVGLLAAASAVVAVEPQPGSALSYLERSNDEFGVDAAVLLEIVGELTGDPRPAEIATLRRSQLPAADREAYGALFGHSKRVLVAVRSADAEVTVSERPALPPAVAEDAAIGPCLAPAVRCELTSECVETVSRRNLSGHDLTQQALWLLFVRWQDCRAKIDLETLQRDLALRLERELESDVSYSELALERVALLGHLGYADALDPLWVPTIQGARHERGCWGVTRDAPCHPRPTLFALWALALLGHPES